MQVLCNYIYISFEMVDKRALDFFLVMSTLKCKNQFSLDVGELLHQYIYLLWLYLYCFLKDLYIVTQDLYFCKYFQVWFEYSVLLAVVIFFFTWSLVVFMEKWIESYTIGNTSIS